mmetsp:Transcript_53016/g.123915  ORF Transcript_53016/g.123915 Transcript_53016/m.123915 type:complete len:127 (+) Transcript_53016:538-918(+)
MNCAPGKGCFPQKTFTKYTITEHGYVWGEQRMMAEILARGPIACSIAVPEALETYTSGVFNDTTGARGDAHDVSVTGWGVDQGVPYWTIRNSWGTYWGEHGWFRLIRGTNNLGVESQGCSWAVPKL